MAEEGREEKGQESNEATLLSLGRLEIGLTKSFQILGWC